MKNAAIIIFIFHISKKLKQMLLLQLSYFLFVVAGFCFFSLFSGDFGGGGGGGSGKRLT